MTGDDNSPTITEDDLMSDNVQSFLNMGILQTKYNTNYGHRNVVEFEKPPPIIMHR